MRTLERNKQKMWYALYGKEVPEYQRDEEGNIVYIEVDGEMVPVDTGGTEIVYETPVEFMANISMAGGEAEAVEYGIDVSAYQAIICTDKDLFPLSETSRIWHAAEPKFTIDGEVDGNSADYKIVKLSPSLSQDRFILAKNVK